MHKNCVRAWRILARMKDGAGLRIVKRVALAHFTLNLAAHRAWRRLRGERPFRLAGDCGRCGACCEVPSIRASRLAWYFPTARALFLAWQRRVNGFELVSVDRRTRVFTFRCTHYDPATRSCDSYDSRPGMCRDYPRLQVWSAAPAFLPGCGYRAVAGNADALIRELAVRKLDPEREARLRRDLHLE